MTTMAILTVGSRRASLMRTIESLGSAPASVGRRLIWHDGPAGGDVSGWESHGTAARQGPPNTHAFWDLVEYVATSGDDLLFFEDDIQASPGSVAYAARMGCPGWAAFVSWFDPVGKWTNQVPKVLYLDAGTIIPCQARTLPAHTLARLAEFRHSHGWRPAVGSDACVAAALRGETAAIHIPSLVQHVGAVSEVSSDVGLSGDRVAGSWLGPTYNVERGFQHVTPRDLWGAG